MTIESCQKVSCKLNRFFKGRIMPFFSNGIGLSFVALANDSVCVATSGRKARCGPSPFVSLRNYFVSMGTVLFDIVKIYEGSCV